MNDSFVMEHVHSPQQISCVASDHVLRKALLGYGPQSTLMTVLHEDVQLHLRGGGEGGGGGGGRNVNSYTVHCTNISVLTGGGER